MIKYLTILLIVLSSCVKKDSSEFWIFKIKEGKHRSTNKVKTINRDNVHFELLLTNSCEYETIDPVNQWDVNKIFGFSDGGGHQKNSARIGWRYVNNELQLMAYTHYNEDFYFKKICVVNTGVYYDCKINCLPDQYEFIVDGDTVYMDRYWIYSNRRYLLWPYFGGDEVAPHDIEIRVKLLDQI